MKTSATLIQSFKATLATVFWYKNELSQFLEASLSDTSILDRFDWNTTPKRVIASEIIDILFSDFELYSQDLETLARDLLRINTYPGLEKQEGATQKINEARRNQDELNRQIALHNTDVDQAKKEKEFQFLKEEFARREIEDAKRNSRRAEDDKLRKENPSKYFGRILKLKGKITFDDIKASHRELIKTYHPDRFNHLDSDFIELANLRAQQINEAFQYFQNLNNKK